MAKKFRARARSFFKAKRRSSKGNSGDSIEKLAVGSAVYGVARPYVANLIPDIPQLQGYSDNVLLGIAGYLGAKKGSGMFKTAGKVVLMNEVFITSSKLMSGTQQQNSSGYIYG